MLLRAHIHSDQQGVFGVEETRKILQAGKQQGWLINFHGEELNPLKSAEVRRTALLGLSFPDLSHELHVPDHQGCKNC